MQNVSTPTLSAQARPTEHHDARKLGIWVFLASETIFFMALIGAYLANRGRSTVGPYPADLFNFSTLWLVALNTFILLTSSYTMVKAYDAVVKDDLKGLRKYLFYTIVGGTFFLGVQAYEYSKLIHEGLSLTVNQFGTTFFILTGIHGAHVAIGVLWLIIVLLMSLFGRFNSRNAVPVDMVALYWHFVDLVWIFIFVLVYLLVPEGTSGVGH